MVLIVPDFLLFNGTINMLFLSKFYSTRIYWLHQDELTGKLPVKSEYPRSFGVKWVTTAPHSCVFVGSWSSNKYSRDSLFPIGYSHVGSNFSFIGKDVLFLWLWAPAYFVKL